MFDLLICVQYLKKKNTSDDIVIDENINVYWSK